MSSSSRCTSPRHHRPMAAAAQHPTDALSLRILQVSYCSIATSFTPFFFLLFFLDSSSSSDLSPSFLSFCIFSPTQTCTELYAQIAAAAAAANDVWLNPFSFLSVAYRDDLASPSRFLPSCCFTLIRRRVYPPCVCVYGC